MKSMAGNVNTSNSQKYHLFSLFENDILARLAKGHYVRYWPLFFFFFFFFFFLIWSADHIFPCVPLPLSVLPVLH